MFFFFSLMCRYESCLISLHGINKIIVFFLVPYYYFGSMDPVVDWLQILEEDQFENQL